MIYKGNNIFHLAYACRHIRKWTVMAFVKEYQINLKVICKTNQEVFFRQKYSRYIIMMRRIYQFKSVTFSRLLLQRSSLQIFLGFVHFNPISLVKNTLLLKLRREHRQ